MKRHKRWMNVKTTVAVTLAGMLTACGGGGGGADVRIDDPTGIRAEIRATGFSDGTAYLQVLEGGIPVFVDRESLDARSQAGVEVAGDANYAHAGARGGFEHYRLRGAVEIEGVPANVEFYGAWGVHNHFTVLGVEAGGVTEFAALSGGRFSEANPVGNLGTATWRGAMIGESGGKILSGDSTLEYDFASATIGVRLTGIRNWNTPQSYPDLVWEGLRVRNGVFTDGRDIRGSFYGPSHEEVGGVFDRNLITGAFGAKRAP